MVRVVASRVLVCPPVTESTAQCSVRRQRRLLALACGKVLFE